MMGGRRAVIKDDWEPQPGTFKCWCTEGCKHAFASRVSADETLCPQCIAKSKSKAKDKHGRPPDRSASPFDPVGSDGPGRIARPARPPRRGDVSAAKRPPLIEVPPTFSFGPLDIDVANYGSEGSAVLGIKGSGKTFTATLLAEKFHAAGIPFIAFDPIGVWRYLRVPGAGPGIPVVVAGGTDGDLALTPATAPAIVEAAMQTGVSLVIDLFSIHLSKADWRRIVRDVVKLLVHKNAPFGLRHVFIEEAAEFIPQRVIEGDVYAAVEQLARIGGNARATGTRS